MVDMNEMNIFSIRTDNKYDYGSFTGNFDTSLFENNSISKIKTSDIEEFMNKMFQETVPWRRIDEHKSNGIPYIIRNNEKYINDPTTIANTFKNFFTSIAETVQSKINVSNKSSRGVLSTKNNDSFIITTTNKEQIYKVISSLNINKSCVSLIVFQLKFYTLPKIKYLNIL